MKLCRLATHSPHPELVGLHRDQCAPEFMLCRHDQCMRDVPHSFGRGVSRDDDGTERLAQIARAKTEKHAASNTHGPSAAAGPTVSSTADARAWRGPLALPPHCFAPDAISHLTFWDCLVFHAFSDSRTTACSPGARAPQLRGISINAAASIIAAPRVCSPRVRRVALVRACCGGLVVGRAGCLRTGKMSIAFGRKSVVSRKRLFLGREHACV